MSFVCKKNTRYRINSIAKHCALSLRSRFIAMGLTPGSEYTVCCIAPLGDPVKIDVKGTLLCLRQHELSYLVSEAIR